MAPSARVLVSCAVSSPPTASDGPEVVTTAGLAGFPSAASIGRFRVLERLAGDSAAARYSAYDPDLDRPVVLFVLTEAASSDRRERLLEQAKQLAAVSHPAVTAVHDAGRHGELVYVAFEPLRGRSISEWAQGLRRHRAGDRRRLLGVIAQAYRALAAVHDRGLVHGAVGPAALRVDEQGQVQLVDFGFAQVEVGASDRGQSTDERCLSALAVSLCFAATSAGRFAPTRGRTGLLRQALERSVAEGEGGAPALERLASAVDAAAPTSRTVVGIAGLFGVGAVVALGVVALAPGSERASPCAEVGDGIDRWWSRAQPELRSAVSGRPWAESTVADTQAYVDAWKQQRLDNCEATKVAGAQSEGVMHHRARCLEYARERLMQTVLRIGEAGDRAPFVIAELPAPTDCSGPAAGSVDAWMPAELDRDRARTVVAALEVERGNPGRAHGDAARWWAARATAQRDQWLAARARMASAEEQPDNYVDALAAAVASADEPYAARVALRAAERGLTEPDAPSRSRWPWMEFADTMGARLPDNLDLAARHAEVAGRIAHDGGDLGAAVEHFDRAIELASSSSPWRGAWLARLRMRRAHALLLSADVDADGQWSAAFDELVTRLGPEHPEVRSWQSLRSEAATEAAGDG